MKYFWIMLLMIGTSFPAHAVSVRNLSGQPQIVVFDQGGHQTEVVIEAGKLYRRHGDAISIHQPGQHPRFTEPHEEYAIWPDGTLAIQRLNQSKGLRN